MAGVADEGFAERLGDVIGRAAGQLGPEVGGQLRQLVEPRSLEIMAAVLVGWLASHAFAVGEIFDLIVGIAGLWAVGTAIFSGIDELIDFARGTYGARTAADLDRAAGHLAKAIAILGVQTVLYFLFRGRPNTGHANPGPPPPRTPGRRYAGQVGVDAALASESAYCSWWGDIFLNTVDTGQVAARLLFHERVHRFLTPKLYLLRNFRIEMRVGSYTGSSLYRWLEEWLAYAVGHGRVREWPQMWASIRFPVQRGYAYWTRAGSNPRLARWGGHGILPEGAGLIATGLILGERMELWFKPGEARRAAPADAPERTPVPVPAPVR